MWAGLRRISHSEASSHHSSSNYTLNLDNMFARIVSRTGVAHLSRRAFSDAVAPTSMKLNFCTPHSAIYSGKEVAKVTLPGELGEFGVTVGHSPIISQLRPGVVSIEHTGVSF